MNHNQFKKESNILTLLYMQIIYRLFSEQENIAALYLINLSFAVSTSNNTDEISETVDSGDINCKNEALNEDETAKFCSGLYYYNARWYDPGLGRFTTEDPIRDGLNWYAYANNNPLRFVDPTGLWTIEAQLALGPGIQVKVGKNEGVFTFGFNVGFGIAAGFYFDKNTEDMSDTKLGTKLTVKEEAKISKGIDPKFGEVSLSAKFEATVNPDLSIENTSEASLEVTDNMTRIKGEMKIETGKEGLQTDHYADTEVSLGIDVGVFAGVGIETNIETSASKDD